jgi:murein DD-endopeptidase MepM/ murein hydrolase activator NlpD
MAAGSGIANAKQSLVKNVVKNSSPKQRAVQEPVKVTKNSAKPPSAKQSSPKLLPVKITKNIVKQVAIKEQKSSEIHAKADTKARADKSVSRQVLVKQQEQTHRLTQTSRHSGRTESLERSVSDDDTSSASNKSVKSSVGFFASPKGGNPVSFAELTKHRRKADRNESNARTLEPEADKPESDTLAKVNTAKEDSFINSRLSADVGSGYTGQLKSEAERYSQFLNFKKHRTIFYKVKPGDTIPRIFADLNLNTYDLHKIIHNRKLSRQFNALIPGKILSINTNARGELTSLAYKNDRFVGLMASSDSHQEYQDSVINSDASHERAFSSEGATTKTVGQIKHVSTHVAIQSSLEQASRNASLPRKITKQLVDIFAWDIDFSQNLSPNDQFTVVYEKIFVNGRAVDTGDIVAAEFVNQGERHQAVRYKDRDGSVSYYTPEGEGMRRPFLRNPVDYVKVSSFFNPFRKHPVLNRIRAHKGVDYAASTGTPIKTTGDGRVVYKGRKGGYGQVVMIEHGHEYTTLYAHLSDFHENLNEGDNVKQGQVIGYVGETGLATGPHLHYEFLVNGVHQDPLTVQLPHSLPINVALIPHFKAQARPLLAQLDQAKTTLLARNMQQE